MIKSRLGAPRDSADHGPDAQLENAISKAGRERVFALVRAVGWSSTDIIPKYVWWDAVRLIERARCPGAAIGKD